MPKKERVIRYKAAPAGTVGTRAGVVSSPVAHGSLQGLGNDDHTQYAAIAQDETISGAWTFSDDITLDSATIDSITPSNHSARHDPDGADELTTAAPGANSVNVAASGAGVAASLSRSDHTHNLDESIVPTWTGAHLFQATMTTRDLLPEATDTYDIGSSTYWYSQQFVSQINAAVFAEEQIMLLGGWLYVSHDAGTFAAEVGAADVKIDFGKAMTASDFVVVKAHVKGGAVATEYIQVGALDAGTTYNVTRDLAGAHAPDPVWAEGTPFAVLGQEDEGHIELNAYDSPRIDIIIQNDNADYSDTTTVLRLGDMNGEFGSDAASEWGFGVGDYSSGNFMAYNTTDGFELKAGDGAVRLDDSGIRLLETGTDNSYVSWKETSFSGDTIAYTTALWGGGAADDIGYWMRSYKATGMSAGDAELYLDATDVDDSSTARFTLTSDGASDGGYLHLTAAGQLSLNVDPGGISNAFMDVGLCINQDTADNEIFCAKSADVSHGMTALANADAYFEIRKSEGTSGGAHLIGYKDADGAAGYAAALTGRLGEAADTTKTTAAVGVVQIAAQIKSGTGITTVGSDGNLCVIANSGTARFIFDAEGSAHADVEHTTFDEYDDVQLLTSLEQSMLAWQGDDPIKDEFAHVLRESRPLLEELGLVHFDDDNPGHVMLNTTRLLMLLTGACRQLGERLAVAEGKLLTAAV